MTWWQWWIERVLLGILFIVGFIGIAASFAFIVKAVRDNWRFRRGKKTDSE